MKIKYTKWKMEKSGNCWYTVSRTGRFLEKLKIEVLFYPQSHLWA
jgi:hypothetical protein